MKTTGVIIARFQTPYLHEGHYSLIEYVKDKHNRVVVVLGISPVKGSVKNPLDFYSRERMVKKAFPEVIVLPFADTKSDRKWSENLDQLLRITFPNERFVLYGSRDSFLTYYSGSNEVKEITQKGEFTAAALRNQICDKVMDSEDFRSGIIYAYYNKYPTVFPTVDIAVLKENSKSLLLGMRDSEGKWRLPGGFADPTDNDFEATALRELHEECGYMEVGAMTYEKSFKVEDWRYKEERDKIITILFSCTHIFGEPKAGDDLDKIEWFSFEKVEEMIQSKQIVKEHFPLINFLIKKYLKQPELEKKQVIAE